MNLLMLIIAFLLTGTINIINKALIQMKLGDFRDVYMIAYFGAPAVIGMITLALRRHHGEGTDRRVGMIMGAGGAMSTLCFLIALQHMPGIVAFPVRSVGNLVAAAAVGIIAWKERLSTSQWIGIALSVVAIWLIYS